MQIIAAQPSTYAAYVNRESLDFVECGAEEFVKLLVAGRIKGIAVLPVTLWRYDVGQVEGYTSQGWINPHKDLGTFQLYQGSPDIMRLYSEACRMQALEQSRTAGIQRAKDFLAKAS